VSSAPQAGNAVRDGFRHEALLYAGDDMFVDRCARFAREGLEAGEPVLVAVDGRKIDLLRQALGEDAGEVEFADMQVLGENPARIIPAWRSFVDRNADAVAVRGVGEPISPSRRPDELDECQRHEMLINRAFADAPGMWLMCPYDTAALNDAVMAEAHRSHPCVRGADGQAPSRRYDADGPGPFDGEFPEAADSAIEVSYDINRLETVRRVVTEIATERGLGEARCERW
jgi:DcmR-like sensory protein